MKKRYQYLAKDGIKWTNWFPINTTTIDNIQIKHKFITLKNEYEKDD